MTGERVSPRDVIADAILYSRYAPMTGDSDRVAGEVITQLEGSGWRIVPAGTEPGTHFPERVEAEYVEVGRIRDGTAEKQEEKR